MPEQKSQIGCACQNQTPERRICLAKGYYQGTTNIRRLAAYYSIKNRKFIRGYLGGSRVSGSILYRLYEGVYVKFDGEYWTKNDPPNEVQICIVRISCPGEEVSSEIEACAVVKYRSSSWLRQNPEIPPQLIDFDAALPGYHRYPAINFDKIYTEEDHKRLIEFIKAGKYIVEGEENE